MLTNWRIKWLPMKSKVDFLDHHGVLIGEMNMEDIQKVFYMMGSRFYEVIYINSKLNKVVDLKNIDNLGNTFKNEFLQEFA